MEKIKVEEFEFYKKRILEIVSELESEEEEVSEEREKELNVEYEDILKNMLGHDLSDIPASMWEGMHIFDTDDFEKAIEKINNDKPIGAAIYTDEAELGYKFINRIHSKNVFVNTSFAELDTKIEDPANVLYMMKKIMYPN